MRPFYNKFALAILVAIFVISLIATLLFLCHSRSPGKGQIDYEHLDSLLRIGMSEEEVTQKLGHPMFVDMVSQGGETFAVHNYIRSITGNELMNNMKKAPDGGYRAVTGCAVFLKDGKVIKYNTSYAYHR